MIKLKKFKKIKFPKININSVRAHYIFTSVALISFFLAIFISLSIFYSSLNNQLEFIDEQISLIADSNIVIPILQNT